MRRIPILVLVALLSASGASALELATGRVRLVLHEKIGRFSLYLLPENRQGDGLPLLVVQDPRTSSVSVSVDNRVYRLGESSDFRGSLEKTPACGRFVWDSNRLRVSMDLAAVSSRPAEPQDAVQITLTLLNTSDTVLKVGARVLLDTYLGENGGAHFTTSASQAIDRETSFTSSDPPSWWASLEPRKQGQTGLQCITNGGGVTTPDRIVMANWKRLNDASWGYDAAASKNFNHLPYSINDSAVAQYYDPRLLGVGEERRIVLLMGAFNPAGYQPAAATGGLAPTAAPSPAPAPGSASSVNTPAAAGTAPAAGTDSLTRLRSSLEALDALLEEIDRRMNSVPATTDEELRALEDRLRALNRDP